jgi:hypothetical protein
MSFTPVRLSAPELVDTSFAGPQQYVAHATLANGQTLVVWQGPHAAYAGDFSPAMRVMAQLYDASGAKTGPETEIHQNVDLAPHNNTSTLYPQVAALEDGGYVIALADQASYETLQLRLKVFNADGSLRSDHSISNPTVEPQPGNIVATTPTTPTLTALDGGGFALAWSASYPGMLAQYAGQTTNFYQSFTAAGGTIASIQQITPWVASVSYSQDYHDWVDDSTALDGGGSVVLYRGGRASPGNPTDTPVIMAQKFGADGLKEGAPVVVNTSTERLQSEPRIATTLDGGFVVIWQSNRAIAESW